MKLEKADIKHLYKEVYYMNGLGLRDFLQDWTKDRVVTLDDFDGKLRVDATLFGEKVLVSGEHYEFGTATIFDRWDLWRCEVAYYFDGFINESESFEQFDDIEKMREYFVWKICNTMGIVERLGEYLKVNTPEIAQNDPLFFC